MFRSRMGVLLLGLLLSTGMPQGVEAALMAVLEGPEEGQEVAGIGIIRGWAFSDTAGVSITQVTLVVDGTSVTSIPCCSERGDVVAGFPQLPSENTLNSGFGITQNYNLNTAGTHTIGVEVRDSSGAQLTLTHTVTVVKPGGFEFIDLVDLSSASVERQGQELVLSGVSARDSASQQTVQIAARLRWFRSLQGLGLIGATTVGTASAAATSSSRSVKVGMGVVQVSSVSSCLEEEIRAVLESPQNGQSVAGIGVIRGWAFAPQGCSIRRVQLLVDGEPFSTIPCCSERGDVAAAFPDEPNALNSGFGIIFNYGLLSSGGHTITVQIEDNAENSPVFTKGVLVKRPGEFEFLDQLDFSNATVRSAGGELIVEGAIARDRAGLRTATRILRYRFDGVVPVSVRDN